MKLIDLTEEEPEAPFAVREADDGPVQRDAGPAGADLWSWFGDHPVVVGIATGIICFAIVATAVSLTVGSGSTGSHDDPVAGAAVSGTDGSRGSFSGDSGNFTSDDPKRTGNVGAPKNVTIDDAGDVDDTQAVSTVPAAPSVGDDAMDVDANATTDPGNDNSGSTDGDSSTGGDTDRNPNNPGNNTNDQDGGGDDTTATTTRQPNTTLRRTSTTRTPSTRGTTPTTRPNVSSTTQGTTPSTQGTSTTSTTRSTTSTTGNTTSSAPTTQPPTTQPPTTQPPPVGLIAAPGAYSVHALATPTNFAANILAGAVDYCWRFSQPGFSSYGPFCDNGTSYQLPAGALGMEPGLVNVTVTASGPSVNESASITIIMTRSSVFARPRNGDSVKIGRTFPVRLVETAGATEYLLRFVQGGYDSDWISYGLSSGVTIKGNDAFWDNVSAGDLTVLASVQGSGRVIGSGSVTVTLTD